MDGTDGKQVLDGTNEDANLEGSNSGNGQQSSNTVTATAKQLKELQDTVNALARSLQSEKDKAVARTNQRIDGLEKDLKEVLRSAAQRGQSVQDVLGEIEAQEEAETRRALFEMAQAFRSGQVPQQVTVGPNTGNGVDVTNVLRELELDEADMRVKEFRSRQFTSEAEAYREGAKLLKTITTKLPSDADMPSSVANGVSSQSKQDALMQEYTSRAKDLRGQALINLKAEMRKKGLRTLY